MRSCSDSDFIGTGSTLICMNIVLFQITPNFFIFLSIKAGQTFLY